MLAVNRRLLLSHHLKIRQQPAQLGHRLTLQGKQKLDIPGCTVGFVHLKLLIDRLTKILSWRKQKF
jgi:hypothetical protein